MSSSDKASSTGIGSPGRFYDDFAPDYDLAYGGDWESAVDRQGEALDQLIRRALPDAHVVLDCACGIGTQAIGLARRGYRVHGTDISTGEIERDARKPLASVSPSRSASPTSAISAASTACSTP